MPDQETLDDVETMQVFAAEEAHIPTPPPAPPEAQVTTETRRTTRTVPAFTRPERQVQDDPFAHFREAGISDCIIERTGPKVWPPRGRGPKKQIDTGIIPGNFALKQVLNGEIPELFGGGVYKVMVKGRRDIEPVILAYPGEPMPLVSVGSLHDLDDDSVAMSMDPAMHFPNYGIPTDQTPVVKAIESMSDQIKSLTQNPQEVREAEAHARAAEANAKAQGNSALLGALTSTANNFVQVFMSQMQEQSRAREAREERARQEQTEWRRDQERIRQEERRDNEARRQQEAEQRRSDETRHLEMLKFESERQSKFTETLMTVMQGQKQTDPVENQLKLVTTVAELVSVLQDRTNPSNADKIMDTVKEVSSAVGPAIQDLVRNWRGDAGNAQAQMHEMQQRAFALGRATQPKAALPAPPPKPQTESEALVEIPEHYINVLDKCRGLIVTKMAPEIAVGVMLVGAPDLLEQLKEVPNAGILTFFFESKKLRLKPEDRMKMEAFLIEVKTPYGAAWLDDLLALIRGDIDPTYEPTTEDEDEEADAPIPPDALAMPEQPAQ